MDSSRSLCCIVVLILFGISIQYQSSASEIDENQTGLLLVNVSEGSAKEIPDTLFGIFFEEINHAGAGGLWAELVSNRDFEFGDSSVPSPWAIIGNNSSVIVSTDLSSCFDRNKVALRVEVLCDNTGANVCPDGGIGVYNPGFWGMNIEQGKSYQLVFYLRSDEPVNLSVALTGSNGLTNLATTPVLVANASNWTKVMVTLEAEGTDPNSRLELRSTTKGVIWFDQVSLMPLDTYNGHGFRKDLFEMLQDLKPAFLRFPGGCFVEGAKLSNAFWWKETIGPWEERPGHFGDVWGYWTDDGLGHFEFLQLAEDLGALPVWVFNSGISHKEQVNTSNISPFVQDVLEGLEFARGASNSTWGSVRAEMGHPDSFDLRYVAVGNEDCEKKFPQYKGNYLKFHSAIKEAYPDIKIISNCDGSSKLLDHPADLYDFHIYASANDVFSNASRFMWTPDAIVFTSSQVYGTPSYWMQHFFKESNGATLIDSTLQDNNLSNSLIASSIKWRNETDDNDYIRIKVVNFGNNTVTLNISISGLENSLQPSGATKTILTSSNVMDENAFTCPKKIIPVETMLDKVGENMDVVLLPYSITSIDLLTKSISI
ncbi:Alpha-L-arabinofuranosidase 1 [Capsicum baccatum]|uniref:non-reducing end alpha-L-arabinofuranosidase n=1 Tax=Capsicum baccatum TaxID=33114 RepID=A0A2G2VW23_CAPBA|nr:Alpha-L-arabinofuranosidase 1 [Capsicum baccatum]